MMISGFSFTDFATGFTALWCLALPAYALVIVRADRKAMVAHTD
jgi:hypothetical protein